MPPVASSSALGRCTFAGIEVPPLSSPKSAYSGHQPHLPKSRERDVLESLLKDGNEDIQLVLDEFVVYRDASTGGRQLGFTPLNDVAIRLGNATFFFDGIIRDATNPSKYYYVERISFGLVSVGGYEDLDQHTVGDSLWVQSTQCRARKDDIWYQLGQPAAEYAEHHRLFIWLANLSKHVVDYFNNHADVTLKDFELHFAGWLISHHRNDPHFVAWLENHGKSDFRQTVVSHADFLLKQACDMDESYGTHTVWKEIGRTNPIIQKQPVGIVSTVVTPFVHRCFKNMVWANHLKVMEFEGQNQLLYQSRLKEMRFNTGSRGRKPRMKQQSGPVKCGSFTISPGDVVATTKDEDSTWKGNKNDELWYALVQDIKTFKNKPSCLQVLWLYRPTDTVCADLTYPNNNELFLSDHCNCEEGDFDITQVVKKVDVSFFTERAFGKAEFFVRQTYKDDQTFTTLKDDDFCCSHRQEVESLCYTVGDTVLVETQVGDEIRLEPTEIVGMNGQEVTVRRLPPRNRFFGSRCNGPSKARPNELVYTNHFDTVSIIQLARPCHVRIYTLEEQQDGLIPVPYNRDGNGDAFYIIVSKDSAVNKFTFKQGFDPLKPVPRLRALNIFSGGGNFDRGLEEGGAIQSEWAVEWGIEQMLTYRANHSDPEQLKPFCGSVNDYLAKAMRGKDALARIGDVEFIAAGSPCQGYSMVNPNKMNEVSMRNCSMVASVAAFVDFYRPQYAILENVPSMASSIHKENPLSQLLCSFVGMGYQVRILNLDAWSFGAPQSRSRLFIIIAAPGLQLPDHPSLTHSHPERTPNRSLGGAPNGLPFGNRQFPIPVFDFVSAYEGTKDLPKLGKGHIVPISDPDHRSARTESTFTQNIIDSVPKFPRTMGLQDALKRGWLQSNQGDSTTRNLDKQKTSRSWSRVDPNHLLPTITTGIGPSCRFTGRCLHWAEDRLITLKEARRAQGFPDSEVIIGTPGQRWKIIGNSVARQVALALGLVIRDACLRNLDVLEEEVAVPNAVATEIQDPAIDKDQRPKSSQSHHVALRRTSMTMTTTTTTTTTTRIDLVGCNSVSPDPIAAEKQGRKRSLRAVDQDESFLNVKPLQKKLKE